MSEFYHQKRGVLYVITCAARSAEPMFIEDFIRLAQANSWNVSVIATPQAINFIDIPLIEKLTGYPVRSEYKHPDEPNILPRADAIVVAPTTFNTINKWALGITDTLALGLLSEYMCSGTPIVSVPCVQQAMTHHPAFPKSVALLKECGVQVLYEPQKYPPMNNVPWKDVLQSLDETITKHHALFRQEEGSLRK